MDCFTLHSSKDNDDEDQSLKQKIRNLYSEHETDEIRTQFRQEMLPNLAIVMEQRSPNIQTDLEDPEQCTTKREHIQPRLEQHLAQIDSKISHQYTKDSIKNLCKVIVTDRKWIEAETMRRASVVKAMKQKMSAQRKRIFTISLT